VIRSPRQRYSLIQKHHFLRPVIVLSRTQYGYIQTSANKGSTTGGHIGMVRALTEVPFRFFVYIRVHSAPPHRGTKRRESKMLRGGVRHGSATSRSATADATELNSQKAALKGTPSRCNRIARRGLVEGRLWRRSNKIQKISRRKNRTRF